MNQYVAESTGLLGSDTSAIQNAWTEWSKRIYNDPDSAFVFAQRAFLIAHNNHADYISRALLRMGNAKQYSGDVSKAILLMHCALEYEEKQPSSSKNKTIILGDLGMAYYNRGAMDTALQYLDQSLEIALSDSLKKQIAFAYQNKARVYNQQGFHKLAITQNLKALSFYEKMRNEPYIASGHNTLGVTHLYAENYKEAINHFKKVAEITRNLGPSEIRFYAESQINTGYAYDQLHMPDSALRFYLNGITSAREANDHIGLAMSEGGAGTAYSLLGQHEAALSYHLQAKRGYDTLGIASYSRNQALAHAHAMLRAGRIAESKNYMQQILQEYPEITETSKELWLDYQIDLSKKERNYAKSLSLVAERAAYRDSLTINKKAIAISELEKIYQLEKKEQEIKLLESEQTKDKWRIRSLVLGLLGLAGVATFLLLYLRKRSKVREQSQRLVLMEKELERKRLESMLDEKDRALTTQSIKYASQQEELQKAIQSLKDINKKPDDKYNEIGKLIRQMNQSLSADEGWEQMIDAFKSVEPDFIQNLKKEFPKLTSSDLRLATLMRMNLDSKSIAQLVNISPESVKRARNRFRQKINIDPKERLQDWIIAR